MGNSNPTIPEKISAQASRAWLGVCLLAVAVAALPNLTYPLGRDQATYCVIGQGLLNGKLLYRDLWDNKPPGIFGLYALLVKIFGHVMWSVGLVDILWIVAISACIFLFTRRYLGTAAGVVAVGANAAWHFGLGYIDAGQPECFLTLLVFAAFFVASQKDSRPIARQLAAGLLMGAAFWMKYNALLFFPLVAVLPYVDFSGVDARPRRLRFMLSWREWFARMAALGAGFLLAVAAVLAYIWRVGGWPALMEVQFKVLPKYGAMPIHRIPHYWAVPIGLTLARLGIWTVVATGAAILLAEKKDLARFLPILAGTAMGYTCTASQLRFHFYTFETSFPFFAMIWGYLASALFDNLRSALSSPSRRTRIWAMGAAAGVAAILVIYPLRIEARAQAERYRNLAWWWRDSDGFYANYPAIQHIVEHFPGKFKLIHALKETLAPGQQIFVWGTDPLIYFMTNRQPPDRFVCNLALISAWGLPEWRQELMRDLKQSPPDFIVVSQADEVPEVAFTPLDSEQFLAVYPELGNFISGSYVRVGNFPNFVLYRRKDAGTIQSANGNPSGQL